MRAPAALFLTFLFCSVALAQSESGIEGLISISPAHGGPQRVGETNTRPLANAEFVVSNENGVVANFTTDNQGHFRVPVAAGHYTVTRKGAAKGIGRCGLFDVDVAAGQFAKVEWTCDSGMR
jgi:hypothetical protein